MSPLVSPIKLLAYPPTLGVQSQVANPSKRTPAPSWAEGLLQSRSCFSWLGQRYCCVAVGGAGPRSPHPGRINPTWHKHPVPCLRLPTQTSVRKADRRVSRIALRHRQRRVVGKARKCPGAMRVCAGRWKGCGRILSSYVWRKGALEYHQTLIVLFQKERNYCTYSRCIGKGLRLDCPSGRSSGNLYLVSISKSRNPYILAVANHGGCLPIVDPSDVQ